MAVNHADGPTKGQPDCDKAMADLPSDNLARTSRGCSGGVLFLVFMYVVGCDAIGMLLGVMMPAVQAAREAAREKQCIENLKRIGAAIQKYHQVHECFPPSFVSDKAGRPPHSWRVAILPFLEEQDLYSQYRLDEPWNSPHNLSLAGRMPAVYRCPSDFVADQSRTNYAMIVGPNAVWDGPTARRASDLDGSGANTIRVMDVANADIVWLEPRDLNSEDVVSCTDAVDFHNQPGERTAGISSPHKACIHALFCDGSVRSIDKNEVKAMLTIDDGSLPVGVR